MWPSREPVRTPSFESVAVPTAFLVLFILISVVAGWTFPDAAAVPLSAGILFGSCYTIFAYFTTALEYLPTSNKWIEIGGKVGIVVLILRADEITPFSDWSILAFVVGLLTALIASHWWLLAKQDESPQNHDQSQPH